MTDRKELGQRDQDRRTGKREIHRDKDWDWDIDRRTRTGEEKIERDTGTESGIE